MFVIKMNSIIFSFFNQKTFDQEEHPYSMTVPIPIVSVQQFQCILLYTHQSFAWCNIDVAHIDIRIKEIFCNWIFDKFFNGTPFWTLLVPNLLQDVCIARKMIDG